jgi:hypothetical protein
VGKDLTKGGIYKVVFSYHFKMGGYTALMLDIQDLYGVVPTKRLPSVVGGNNNQIQHTKKKSTVGGINHE